MKERPIIFSGFSVRAILAGAKTQTRRVDDRIEDGNRCPFGGAGTRLWVRESFRAWTQPTPEYDECYLITDRIGGDYLEWNSLPEIQYRATSESPLGEQPWRSSLYMPRWASRITLEVTGVRVERLQDITEDDAKAEGATLDPVKVKLNGELADFYPMNHRIAFSVHWEHINGKKHPWPSNPWVWVVSFRKVDAC